MIAKQLITSHILPLKSSDSCAFALAQMDEARLSDLPVVDGNSFVGIITEHDLLALDSLETELGILPNLQTRVCVNGEQHIYEALKMFSTLNLTMLPVVDDSNNYLGGITLQTIVASLAELVGIQDPGGVIVLELRDKDYSLAEIVQIVESNGAKILSCFVSSIPHSSKLQVTIKVNHIEIGPLLQAFFRLDFHVTASWSNENLYNEGLKDRFDALMNYLNI